MAKESASPVILLAPNWSAMGQWACVRPVFFFKKKRKEKLRKKGDKKKYTKMKMKMKNNRRRKCSLGAHFPRWSSSTRIMRRLDSLTSGLDCVLFFPLSCKFNSVFSVVQVHGLTTAAAIWLSAAAGTAAGIPLPTPHICPTLLAACQ